MACRLIYLLMLADHDDYLVELSKGGDDKCDVFSRRSRLILIACYGAYLLKEFEIIHMSL